LFRSIIKIHTTSQLHNRGVSAHVPHHEIIAVKFQSICAGKTGKQDIRTDFNGDDGKILIPSGFWTRILRAWSLAVRNQTPSLPP
jgi:hypothetical protein